MPDESVVRPRLPVLSEAQKQHVHRRSLDILSTVGLRVDSASVRQLFAAAAGAAGGVAVDAASRVRWAPHAVPSTVQIYDRLGRPRAVDLLREHTQHLLNEAPPHRDRGDILARGKAFIDTL